MKIEFGDARIGDTARKHINECLDSNWVTSGKKVIQFEQEYAQLMDYKYVKAVNSGTSADFIACLCLYDLIGTKPGDEVIVPALGFIAAQNSIVAANLIPVPCDIKIETLNIDELLIEPLITDKTRAIMAINTMGKPCRMDVIRKICDKYKLILIVDNCEAVGCRFNDEFMSYYGDIITYSFYSAHLIFACQQGAVCSNRQDVDDLVKSIRTHGRKNGALKFEHERFGWNCQPNDLCASIGLESIANFGETFYKRQDNLIYMLGRLDHSIFYMNREEENDLNSPHALSLTFKDDNEDRFDRFYNYLLENNIHCKLNFKSAFTQQKALSRFGYKIGQFPEAEYVGRNGLHLPIHSFLSKNDLDYMIDTIREFKY